jgi:DNA invertase Pin-like site-specific DNA recombinase
MHEDFPREGDGRAQRPPPTSQNAGHPRAGRAPGDVVTVTRIDRLARSTFDLFAIVKQIVDAKAQFRSLAEPWADTGTSTGRLMIAVLGGLADVERDLIRTRTADGRSRAQKRGQHMGRPSKLTDPQKAEARRRRAEGATLAELARSYDVGKSTISRIASSPPAVILQCAVAALASLFLSVARISTS